MMSDVMQGMVMVAGMVLLLWLWMRGFPAVAEKMPLVPRWKGR